jgi:hypothetical protein
MFLSLASLLAVAVPLSQFAAEARLTGAVVKAALICSMPFPFTAFLVANKKNSPLLGSLLMLDAGIIANIVGIGNMDPETVGLLETGTYYELELSGSSPF